MRYHLNVTHSWVREAMVSLSHRGLFSGKAEKMSAELAHAEQVMLEHEKQHFSDKHIKHHKDKEGDRADAAREKYSSLYSSFDVMKSHEELLQGHKVFSVDRTTTIHCGHHTQSV